MASTEAQLGETEVTSRATSWDQRACPGPAPSRRSLFPSRRRGCGCFNRAGGLRAAPPTSWASADRAGLCLLPGRPPAASLRRRRLRRAGPRRSWGSSHRRLPAALQPPAPRPFLPLLLLAAWRSHRAGALPALTHGEVGMLPAGFPEL